MMMSCASARLIRRRRGSRRAPAALRAGTLAFRRPSVNTGTSAGNGRVARRNGIPPARRQRLVRQPREARFGEFDRLVEFVLRQRRAHAQFRQRAAGADLLMVGAREHARQLFEVAAQERGFGGTFDQRLHELCVIGAERLARIQRKQREAAAAVFERGLELAFDAALRAPRAGCSARSRCVATRPRRTVRRPR